MLQPSSDSTQPLYDSRNAIATHGGSVDILVVDDDLDTAALVGVIARKAGFTTLGASNGQECLSILRRKTPRLIVLDINMLGMDGFEICRRLRRDPDIGEVPIAFLTGRRAEGDIKRATAAGGDDFILKPFDARRLVRHLEFLVTHMNAVLGRRLRR
jgi:DNA-binding response OmpR family regulator